MRLAQDGDLRSFEVLVRRHSEGLYRLAWRLLRDPHEAEDVVQDVWLTAWRYLPGFRGDAALRTWLHRLTVNQVARSTRRQRPAPVDVAADGAFDRPAAEELEPPAVAEQVDRRAAVRAAVGSLSARQRAPLVLREFEGLSYEEVAATLGLSLAAVKSRLHRARLELAEAEEVAAWR